MSLATLKKDTCHRQKKQGSAPYFGKAQRFLLQDSSIEKREAVGSGYKIYNTLKNF